MYNASQDFINAMTSPIAEVYVKMELLDKNEQTIDEFSYQVNSESVGDISVDKTRDIRRMFTLTLDNGDGRFTWGNNKLIYIDNKRIKLHIGLKTPSGIEYIPQGVFVITQPQSISKPGDKSAVINGQDKTYLLTGNFGRFESVEFTIPKGMKTRDAIQVIAQNGGVDRMILDDCDILTEYDHTYQISQNRWEAMKDLADRVQYEIYFDVNGYLRFTPWKDPLLEAPCWTYKIDDQTLYAGSVRTLEENELYNVVLARGGRSTSSTVTFIQSIDETDPVYTEFVNHPFSIQKIGKRFWAYNSGNPDTKTIITLADAKARVRYELNKCLAYSEKVSMDLAPNYLHEAGDVIEIIDNNNGCAGSYELQVFNIPIKPKLVTAEALRVRKETVQWRD